MDFFGQQDIARRRTGWLVGLYALAVAGIILSLYAAVVVIFGVGEMVEEPGLWYPEAFFWVAVGTLVVVVTGSLVKTAQLAGGGAAVARSLGGRPVQPGTTDPDERRLMNVVEEMALAAGTVVPQVYLLDHEPGINAFAAGFSPRDAVIGVTRGCVQTLTRDELQGVIAHEFSHIVNGDMRLNIRLIGILFGILMLTVVGRILLRTVYFSGGGRSRGGNKRGGNPLPFLGLALIVIGYIGVFFANLIKSAVSRQREFLADASAVQYTRNPSGIAGALKRIAGFSHGTRVANAHASEASHLFFGEALGSGLMSLFATHPPLKERIQRLDPASNPQVNEWASAGAPGAVGDGAALGFAGAGAGAAAGGGGTAGTAVNAAGGVDLAAARRVLERVPEALREAAHEPVAARALIYALLHSDEMAVRKRQDAIVQSLDPRAAARLADLLPAVRTMPRDVRLPLAELAVPALKSVSREEYRAFRKAVEGLTEADEQLNLFEYAMRHLILRHVEPAFGKVSAAPVRHRSVAAVLPACRSVLASLAAWGTESVEAAAACYRDGMLALVPNPEPYDPAMASLEGVDKALDRLAEAAAPVKRQVLDACMRCVMADGKVAQEQGELLRAVADAMDVPLPPV